MMMMMTTTRVMMNDDVVFAVDLWQSCCAVVLFCAPRIYTIMR